MNASDEQIGVHIRWMIRRDMPEVLAIEHDSYDFPWHQDDFIRLTGQRSCIGMVAEHEQQVIGFMVYELHKSRIHLLNFCVHPEFRRKSVGTQMVRKLIAKLSTQRRNRIMKCVRRTCPRSCSFETRASVRSPCSETSMTTPLKTGS